MAVADRRNMLEYLRQLKISALTRNDAEASAVSDKTMDLWQKMMLSDNDHRSKMITDYNEVVSAAAAIINDLSTTVAKFEHNKMDLTPYVREIERLAGMESMNITLKQQLEAANDKISQQDGVISDLQNKLKKMADEHAPCQNNIDGLQKRLAEQAAAAGVPARSQVCVPMNILHS